MTITNAAGRRVVLNPRNGDPYILLLTVEHDSFASTWRYTPNGEDVVSNGNTFTAYPFTVSLPTADDGAARGTIQISNVSQAIWDAADVDDPPTIKLQMVLASDPDTVQQEWSLLELRRITGSFMSVEAEFSHENYLSEPWPKQRLTPARAPWLNLVGR